MDYLKRIVVCTPLTVVVIAVSMLPSLQFTHWQWVVAGLTMPVVTWGAWPFHRAALVNARHLSSTMDTLVSLGVTASTSWSWWVLLRDAGAFGNHLVNHLSPHEHLDIYFEGAATITLFLLVGRYIEAKTKGVARDALTSLLHMSAPQATLLASDEQGGRVEKIVPTETLSVGDRVLVKPGEKLPADGRVVEGSSAVDASVVTGESVPVDVTVGDEVTGGTVNTWGALVVEVSAVGAEATLARIGQMVADAQAGKADVQRLADRISAVFVPAVIVVSALTFTVWISVGGGAQSAMAASVAVLVVACPCALGLATPTALMVGSAQAARHGIILRSVHALEATRRLTTVVLDKTGTLTDAKMQVVDSAVHTTQADGSQWGEAAQWAAAASVEALSEHPLAHAIVQAAASENRHPQTVEGFTAHAGHGVSATLGEDLIIVGKPGWFEELGIGAPDALRSFRDQHEARGATVVVMARIRNAAPALSTQASTPSSVANGDLAAGKEEAPEGLAAMELSISGMTCASCVGRVERKLRKMGGLSASVNLATERVVISRERDWHPEDIIATIEGAGYDAEFLGWKEAAHQTGQASPASAGVDTAELQRIVSRSEGAQMSAAFAVKDGVKPDAAPAIARLHQQGIDTVLLTGDHQAAAQEVADQVGISTLFAQVTPGDKLEKIRLLQGEGKVVGMVGDGVNDAAALAQADLGMAMGSGTDVAQDVADIVLTTSWVSAVPQAVAMSQATLRVIKQNLGWAFGYNVILIPLAVAGMLNPMLAAAAMSMSSVCVVANSLRLRSIIARQA